MAGLHKPSKLHFSLEDNGSFTSEEIESLVKLKKTLEEKFGAFDVKITPISEQAAYQMSFPGNEQQTMNTYSEFVNAITQATKDHFLVCGMEVGFYESESLNQEEHRVSFTMKRK